MMISLGLWLLSLLKAFLETKSLRTRQKVIDEKGCQPFWISSPSFIQS